MAIPIELLIDIGKVEVSESTFLPSYFPIDYTNPSGLRFLRAGNIETDTGTYDTTKHLGVHAGSASLSIRGGTHRYVRIT